MAQTIQIPGPTVLQVALGPAAAFADLGQSDNDNLPEIAFSDHSREVKTSSGGESPQEIVLNGITATLSVTLVSWDEDLLASIKARQRGTTEGKSVVGRRLFASTDQGAIRLKLKSVDGTTAYLFGRCWIKPDGERDSQWGNRERTLTLNFGCTPDSGGQLYDYTA